MDKDYSAISSFFFPFPRFSLVDVSFPGIFSKRSGYCVVVSVEPNITTPSPTMGALRRVTVNSFVVFACPVSVEEEREEGTLSGMLVRLEGDFLLKGSSSKKG